ncbi:autophagy protein Apg5-domain-containing protein [Entophlyctis helioformis]|nr:autophagy protein Apg5-domain-containing protein [Entophlyctis helioformis]
MSREPRRRVWDGCVPLQIALQTATTAAAPHAQPRVHHMLVPRGSYLPLIVPDLLRVLPAVSSTAAGSGSGAVSGAVSGSGAGPSQPAVDASSVWFDADGIPLKWHYPVGLLYDIHISQALAAGRTVPAPWSITAHLGDRDFPADRLIPMDAPGSGPNHPQHHFMSMIKQADYLRTGSIKRAMAMSKADQTKLWDSLLSNDYDAFCEANALLVPPMVTGAGHLAQPAVASGSGDGSPIVAAAATPGSAGGGGLGALPRSIPLRIYLADGASVVQDLVPPTDATSSAETTVADVVAALLPVPAPTGQQQEQARSRAGATGQRLMLHGAPLAGEMPLLWLSHHAAYPDGFLHLVELPPL